MPTENYNRNYNSDHCWRPSEGKHSWKKVLIFHLPTVTYLLAHVAWPELKIPP
jgi:hypothetical protein